MGASLPVEILCSDPTGMGRQRRVGRKGRWLVGLGFRSWTRARARTAANWAS